LGGGGGRGAFKRSAGEQPEKSPWNREVNKEISAVYGSRKTTSEAGEGRRRVMPVCKKTKG